MKCKTSACDLRCDCNERAIKIYQNDENLTVDFRFIEI